jgi:hypothetical protein
VIDPKSSVIYNGTTMTIERVPDTLIRHLLGLGHHPEDIRTRQRHDGDWACEPTSCTRADETAGTWINGGSNLVCPGCGLEFT